MKSSFFFAIFILANFAFSNAQYDFFDNYVKNFLKNIFQNNNGRGSSSSGSTPSRNQLPDQRPPSCECSMKNDDRIINGKESEFVPWIVSLGYVFKKSSGEIKYSHFCGGAIISKIHILTAGHCLKDLSKSSMSNYLARIGITDLNERVTRENTVQWKDFKINEKYVRNHEDNNNDIGIITLQKPIDLRNGRVRAACLDFSNNYPAYLSLSGWGRTNVFGKHNQTENVALPNKLMQLDMKEDKQKSTNYIISAVGKNKNSGTCSGDSGSPLQAVSPRRVSVVGLVSYGVSNKDGVFCLANTGFVRLGAHKQFIESTIGDRNFCRA